MMSCLFANDSPKTEIILVGKRSGKNLGRGPTVFIVPFSRKTETPNALMSGASRPALRSGLYATRSIASPSAAEKLIAPRNTRTRAISRIPRGKGEVNAVALSRNTATIAPIMNRSPWAKFMSWRTPYTIV